MNIEHEEVSDELVDEITNTLLLKFKELVDSNEDITVVAMDIVSTLQSLLVNHPNYDKILEPLLTELMGRLVVLGTFEQMIRIDGKVE
jgi:hypothetical protein